jgi:hypothetical protein
MIFSSTRNLITNSILPGRTIVAGLRRAADNDLPNWSLWAVFCLASLCLVGAADAQWLKGGFDDLPRPLVDSEPFDLIQLNKRGENALLRVKPLGKAMPTKPFPQRGVLPFEYFADFDERLEVPLSSVETIQSFNQLLVQEADALVGEKKYAKAFRNLLYVYDHGGSDDASMVDTMRKCMFYDAKENFRAKDFELSLSIYEDIYSTRAEQNDLDLDEPLIDVIMDCYEGIIQNKFDAGEYTSVRANVIAVAEKYPEAAAELAERWTKAFVKRSDELLEQAQEYASQGKGRLAHQLARKADQIVPDRPEVLAYQEELLNQFPLVVVGVSQPPGDADPTRIEHWGARRTGRLVQRRILELSGLTDEGGNYSFLNGTLLRTDEVGLRYTFEINDEPRFGVPRLNAFELSTRLIARGQPGSPSYNLGWAKVVDRVFVEADNKVTFTLKTPFIRPEALLSTTYEDYDLSAADAAGSGEVESRQNGPYVLANLDAKVATFEVNAAYESVLDGNLHPVIVEQLYGSMSSAVDDLMAGNIDVVDRVSIGDYQRLRDDPKIGIRPYVLPTVHLLVPKIRNQELANNLYFRTGLSHLIDRESIVEDVICGGVEIDGCEPISGPFPLGTEENDQIGYAYDLSAQPIAYNEPLGRVLTELVMQPKPPKRLEPIKPPSLTIVHPASSSAANASAAIARGWTQAGFNTEVRELKPGQSFPDDPNWDFLYLEITVEEPLTDAHRLIGPQGFAKDVSAPIEQTLRILNYARSWQSSSSALRRLHRQVRTDLSVIPLWQVTEYYAFRNTIRNVGRNIVHLYQQVDRWKIDLSAKEEQEK